VASNKVFNTCSAVGGVTTVSAGVAGGGAAGGDTGFFVSVVVIGNIPLSLDRAVTLAIPRPCEKHEKLSDERVFSAVIRMYAIPGYRTRLTFLRYGPPV
jgi:microcompartment protein CcmL/EutN